MIFTEKEVREARWAADLQVPMVAIQIVMEHAVSLYLARASGQVKEDALRLRRALMPFSDGEFRNGLLAGVDRLSALAHDRERIGAELTLCQKERDAAADRASGTEHEAEALRVNDHESMEQLAHALGWKDGGPGWQAALDAIGELRAKAAELQKQQSLNANRNHVLYAELREARADAERERERAGTLHRTWERSEHEVTGLRAEVDTLKSRCDVLRESAGTAWSEMLRYRAEVERLKADVERQYKALEACQAQLDDRGMLELRAESAESRLAAIRERAAQLTCGVIERVNLNWVLDGDAPQEAKPKGALVIGDDGAPLLVTKDGMRYPCTHDDADTPVHPGRVKERSEAVARALGGIVTTRRHATEDEQTAYQVGLDEGAEAMRAACWEVVQKELHRYGMHTALKDFKAAIEGAAP